MALVNCPECKKEISNKAKLCPQCGYDISKYMKKTWIAKNKRKMISWLLAVICLLVVISGCVIGLRYVRDEKEKKEKQQKDSIYLKLTSTYDDLEQIVYIIMADATVIDNDETKVLEHVDIMFSDTYEIDNILNSETTEDVKRKFTGYIYNSQRQIYSWEDFKQKVLKEFCFWSDDKEETVKKIIDYTKTKASDNYDNITIGMERSEVLKMMGNDYMKYYEDGNQVYKWNKRFVIVIKDEVVIEKRKE